MIHRISRRQVIAAAAAAPAAALQARMAVAQTLTRIRLTAGANIGYSHQYVGEATGIFRKHNIDGSVILFDVGFLGTEAVIAGQAETSGTVEFPLMGLLARGADLVVPAIMITADDLKIVALTSIAKPADLAGKRVAYIFGSSAHYALYRYCLRHGIAWDQIKGVNVPASEQVAVLARGDVDAFVWLEPMVQRGLDVMKGRAHVLKPGIETAYRTRTYLQMSRAWVDRNPEATVALLRALIECDAFVRAEPRKTAEIAAKKLNIPVDTAAGLLKSVGFDWRIYLDAEAKKVFAEVATWMRDNGRLKGDTPNMDRVFVPQYLRQIDPALVIGF